LSKKRKKKRKAITRRRRRRGRERERDRERHFRNLRKATTQGVGEIRGNEERERRESKQNKKFTANHSFIFVFCNDNGTYR